MVTKTKQIVAGKGLEVWAEARLEENALQMQKGIISCHPRRDPQCQMHGLLQASGGDIGSRIRAVNRQ